MLFFVDLEYEVFDVGMGVVFGIWDFLVFLVVVIDIFVVILFFVFCIEGFYWEVCI